MGLLIVGAKADGQAPVVLDALESSECLAAVALADDDPALWGTQVLGVPVLGALDSLGDEIEALGLEAAFVAIGDGEARLQVSARCKGLGLALPTVVHPAACVSRYASLGEGVYVGAGAQVLPGAAVGDHVRINAGAVISHHAQVGEGANIGPNATLTGRARVGAGAFIGAGSVVLNDVEVGQGVVVGAGAVVHRDVPPGVTVVGVPARPLERA